MISEPMVHSAQTMHLSCIKISTISKWTIQTDRNEIPYDPRHLGVPSGASKTISEPMLCSAQTMHLSCVKTDPMGRLAQIVHLSCTDTNIIPKWTEMSFHLSLVT